MTLTMPRNLGPNHERGDYREACDYCGITWYRSSMRRDASGLLACPDDQDGRDKVTLDRANQRAGMQGRRAPRGRW